jgi:hypothetical protein
MVSSAVNLPITSASLRLVVVWMGVRSIRCTNSGARVPPRFSFTTNLVFFIVCHYFYSTLGNRIPRSIRRGSAFPSRSSAVWLVLATVAKDTAYYLSMSRLYPECPDSDVSDRSVAVDVLLRQQPEEEDEEDDEGYSE